MTIIGDRGQNGSGHSRDIFKSLAFSEMHLRYIVSYLGYP
jgi:hypothetical protein